MRLLLAALGTAALAVITSPPSQATPQDWLVQSLSQDQTSFAKGGHGQGWKGAKHTRGWGQRGGRHWRRGGPPPWAPAHGWRRKHRW